MAAKSDESKFSKVKSFLGRLTTSRGAELVQPTNIPPKIFDINDEILKSVGVGNTIGRRVEVLKDVLDLLHRRKLESHSIEDLWTCTEDLLRPQIAPEYRQFYLKFLAALVKSQNDEMGILRAHFFNVVKGHTLFEDLDDRLFSELTDEGRNLLYFESEVGPFLLLWMKDIMSSKRVVEFLELMINIIQYNAAYIDEDVLTGIVLHTCVIAGHTAEATYITYALELLQTVLAYSSLPESALRHVIVCICQLITVQQFSADVWKLARKLLGTHLGHLGIQIMCSIMEDKENQTETGTQLVAGSVVVTSGALWGSENIWSLRYPVCCVVPFFQQAVHNSRAPFVLYHVTSALNRLVMKHGADEPFVTWCLLLDLLEGLISAANAHDDVTKYIHEVISQIEELQTKGKYSGSEERLFQIVETVAADRPDNSIARLLNYKFSQLKEKRSAAEYHTVLQKLLEDFYRDSTRTEVRLHSVRLVMDLLESNLFEDSMAVELVLNSFQDVAMESDPFVRRRVSRVLLQMAISSSAQCSRVLDIVEKILAGNTPCSPLSPNARIQSKRDVEDDDVVICARGLVELFKTKFFSYQQSESTLLKAFHLLISHIETHYTTDYVLLTFDEVRLEIFECVLSLRLDDLNCFGLPSNNGYRYSAAVLQSDGTGALKTLEESITLPYSKVLSCDYVWPVLKTVLLRFDDLLKSKKLVSVCDYNDLDAIVCRLCSLASGDSHTTSFTERLVHAPPHFARADLQETVYSVLHSFTSYAFLLSKGRMVELVKCFELGLISKSARVCAHALALCVVEMRDALKHELRSVLRRMSKITASPALATSIVEFLSTMIDVPELYIHFTEEEYLTLFAVALPYTNPLKFNHYTVSLAYGVIAKWFLKCRLPMRKNFVGFIVKSLANVCRQIEEHIMLCNRQQENIERTRVKSLNTEAERKRAATAAANARARATTSGTDQTMFSFHQELMETCLDMLSSFSFGNCSGVPRRSPVADFVFTGGQRKRWLIGNRIVSITTSGGARVTRAALCERCLEIARMASENLTNAQSRMLTPQLTVTSPSKDRRRHRSAVVASYSETLHLRKTSHDDLALRRKSSLVDCREDEPLTLPGDGSRTSLDDLEREASSKMAALKRNDSSKVADLESRTQKLQAVDSVLMSLKPDTSEKSIFSQAICNCWCTQWTEVHIRHPTGTTSWVMRSQNELDLGDVFPQFSLSDISNLLAGGDSNNENCYRDDDSSSLNESDDLENGETTENNHSGISVKVSESPDKPTSLDDVNGSRPKLKKSTSSPELTPTEPEKCLSNELSAQPVLNLTAASPTPATISTPEAKTHRPLAASASSPMPTSQPQKTASDNLMQGGSNPNSLFLKLFYGFGLSNESKFRPIPLPETEVVDRSIKMLDLIFTYETHKIAVIYVGRGQANDEPAILANEDGSVRYSCFLRGIGDLLRLKDCSAVRYLGGLDRSGSDGQFTYAWLDDFTQVVFHVATLMPSKENDPKCNGKKRHLGNDSVTIVYNDSGDEYSMGTIKGQFNYANIIIAPCDEKNNIVTVQARPDVLELVGQSIRSMVVSDATLDVIVRKLALHLNLASQILQRQSPKDPYASNWLERLRQIKRLKAKILPDSSHFPLIEDFSQLLL